jgi:hypothetical protein
LAITYRIDPSTRIVAVTAEGNVSMADRYEYVERIAFDERLPDDANMLIDVRGETFLPTEAEIRGMAVLAGEMRGRFARRIAFVTLPGEYDYRIVAAFSSQMIGGVMAFDSEQEAEEWLRT